MIFSDYNKLNITFCGMMGSGKSIIGKKFAKIIDFKFLDTDSFIEQKTGKTINQIFSESGEVFFRELEEIYITKILEKKNYVFSLGGGVMNNLNLRKIIKRNSCNIYLEVDINILSKRLDSSRNRPLINNTNIKKKLKELLEERQKFYKQADLTIKNDKKIFDTINELKNNFQIYE